MDRLDSALLSFRVEVAKNKAVEHRQNGSAPQNVGRFNDLLGPRFA